MIQASLAAPILSDSDRWKAVEARDRAADGLFFFGVSTTGVYCRPSCPARRALREHVTFFRTAAEAQRAGLRACKRCRPEDALEPALALCQTVMRTLEQSPARRLSDANLAALGFEPVQVRRVFLAQFGRTFHAYSREWRVARAQVQVGAGRSLSEAGARAGFESESGLRAAFRAVLDATPAQARSRATIEVTRLASPLGPLTVAANREGVCLVEFDLAGAEGSSGQRAQVSLQRVADRLDCIAVAGSNVHLETLSLQLEQWFAGKRKAFDVPIVHAGTAFQIEVWRALASVPFGETWSYGQLARAIGRPNSSRAVGHANSMNPIAILVPCHRVIGTSGKLTGYAAGLDRKRWLLEHERAVLAGTS
ncbi:MAG TPA: methylated-DNA--[protein]-cysteine S-methyltransferase [Planctomycetota bacterium]|nr:methylated-DNA--[protein]-cysteine S-methyltransferase [Planctomycetota bacterium]